VPTGKRLRDEEAVFIPENTRKITFELNEHLHVLREAIFLGLSHLGEGLHHVLSILQELSSSSLGDGIIHADCKHLNLMLFDGKKVFDGPAELTFVERGRVESSFSPDTFAA
jgi:hypothetical protein